MRRVAKGWLPVALLVVLGTYGLPAHAEPGAQNTREDAVTSLLDADRAWARTTTAEGFTSFLADDAIYVLFHRRVMDGKKEWGPWANQLFSSAEFALDWEAVRVEVGPSADMGYTAGDWRATWKDAEGKPMDLAGSYLAVWERQDDGKWKVIAETEYTGPSVWAARNSAPVSCYLVALIDIHDQERYREYLDGFNEVFEKHDGEVVAVEDHPSVLEGTWPAGRTVLIRFPSELALRHWYDSPEYQRLARHRRAAATASIAVIAGRD